MFGGATQAIREGREFAQEVRGMIDHRKQQKHSESILAKEVPDVTARDIASVATYNVPLANLLLQEKSIAAEKDAKKREMRTEQYQKFTDLAGNLLNAARMMPEPDREMWINEQTEMMHDHAPPDAREGLQRGLDFFWSLLPDTSDHSIAYAMGALGQGNDRAEAMKHANRMELERLKIEGREDMEKLAREGREDLQTLKGQQATDLEAQRQKGQEKLETAKQLGRKEILKLEAAAKRANIDPSKLEQEVEFVEKWLKRRGIDVSPENTIEAYRQFKVDPATYPESFAEKRLRATAGAGEVVTPNNVSQLFGGGGTNSNAAPPAKPPSKPKPKPATQEEDDLQGLFSGS